MKAKNVRTNPAPQEELAALYARARRARAVAIHDIAVRFFHKLTPRLSMGRWGEHWG